MRDPDELTRAVRELASAAELALDTEGDSLHHYPERLALIQIGVPDGGVWLVDPLALSDLTPLAPLFVSGPRLVLHAGDNDLVHLKRRYGLGFWMFDRGDAVFLEGYDAGVSFRSVHDPGGALTWTVISNTSEGAWPIVRPCITTRRIVTRSSFAACSSSTPGGRPQAPSPFSSSR